MTLTALDEHDPRLRQVCATLTKADLRRREQQLEIDALLGFVYGVTNKALHYAQRDMSRPNTVGLSANQVGIMKQICVVDLSIGRRGYSDVHVLINPKIVWRSKARAEKPEGCVNFPTTWGTTVRSSSVKVQALDRSGNEIEIKVAGWPAVLMQHETDHTHGRLFIDRLVDPTKAHMVTPEDYSEYRKGSASDWTKFVDVSRRAVPLPFDAV